MDESEYSHPDAAKDFRPPLKSRFRFRTVLFPLLFLALHWLVLNLTATAYIITLVVIQGMNGSLNITEVLSDTARLESLISEHYPVITVCYAAILIPIYVFYLKHSRRQDQRQLLLEPLRLKDTLLAVAMMIGALGVTNIWFAVLTRLGDGIPAIGKLLDDYEKQATAFTPAVGYFWLILGISVMAPVVEELLFRGIIQGELRKVMPEWIAIIAQAVIFALFHMQPVQITYVFLPGLLLGLAYYWSKSIWVPIIMHISFNFIGSVMPALIGENEILLQVLVWSEIAFILLGTFAAVLFHLNRRRVSDKISPDT